MRIDPSKTCKSQVALRLLRWSVQKRRHLPWKASLVTRMPGGKSAWNCSFEKALENAGNVFGKTLDRTGSPARCLLREDPLLGADARKLD